MSRLRSSLYPRTLRAFDASVAVGRVLFEGLWLGFSDGDDLAAVDDWYYSTTATYAAEAHNRAGLFDWERRMLQQYFVPGGRILVSATGGGREVAGLLDAGYQAHGFECNRLLATAAARLLDTLGQAGRIEWTPRGSWPDVSEPFDGAILGWGSYGLEATPAGRIDMLRQAAARVRAGSPILLSFLAVPSYGREDHAIARIAGGVRRLRRRPPAQLGDRLAPNFVHRFTREQIERELELSGLELRHYCAEGYGHAVAVIPGVS